MTPDDGSVTIRLTSDEAPVLFDWLHRCEDVGAVVGPEHQADQIALWNLSASLERKLVQPFQPEYGRLVNEARVRLAEGRSA